MERGLQNLGINNLIIFWSEKIRNNTTNFFVDQNLLILIDEIDQKITKIESKKQLRDKEKQKELEKKREQKIASAKGRISVPAPYKPFIKDKEKEKNQNNIRDTKNTYISKNINIDNIRRNERRSVETRRYNRNTENEAKQTKSPDINLNYKKEYLTNINNLQKNTFNYQEEKLGENILEISKKDQNIISYIDIDLFLQRIAQDKKIYDDMNDNDTVLKGMCIQHPIFITTNTFISKIISCFNYFYTRYLNQDSEKEKEDNQNKNKVSTERKYQSNNKRPALGYRTKYKQNKEVKKPTKDLFNSVLFVKNLKKIPYCLIDLLILFIDLNEKYSKNILTNEIISKIHNFYSSILDIYDVKNKYKEDIDYSNKILNNISKASILKRAKTQGKRFEYEEIVSNKSLLANKIRDPNKPLSFFNILDYDSKDIANELTRISYHIFSKIEPKEFFKGVFTKKNKNVTSPNITEVANRFNQLSFWLIEEILCYDYGNDRAQVIEKFIDIANELIELNNFTDSMSIVTGLGQMIVTGLEKSWKYVSKESNKTLANLKKIVNFQDNYKNMRDKIDECLKNNKPYIPFLGPYNKRICFLEEYGPYVKDNSLINADKIVLVQQILDQLYKFKIRKYEFVRSTLKEFAILQCLDPSPEEELEKLAGFIEPNFVYNNKRSHEKRASNTEKNFRENYEKIENLI